MYIYGKIEENHGNIEENHGKTEAHHGQTNENDGKRDKNHRKNPETSRKIDEQCEWESFATKCSKWEILAAKTKEGSLDDQKNKIAPPKNVNLISHPYINTI